MAKGTVYIAVHGPTWSGGTAW